MRKTNTFKYKDIEFHSLFEVEFAKNLNKRGIRFQYEKTALVYKLPVRNAMCTRCGGDGEVYSIHNYYPDFYLTDLGMYIETKGKFSAKDRSKILSVKEVHPGIDLRLIFMRDNWITRNHVTKYSDWCTKKGIKFGFLFLPDEWLTEKEI